MQSRPNLLAILSNSVWLLADKILRMCVGLFVGVWIARYLGPEQFGLWNFAIAFTAIFSAFSTMGLDGIVIRELVKNPHRQNELLGSAFVIKLFGGVLAILLALIAVLLMRGVEVITLWLVGLSAAGFIFQSINVIDFYFQSKIKSKYTVYAANAAFILMTIVKIILLITAAPLIAFALTGLGEVVLTAIFLLMAYKLNHSSIGDWCFSWLVAKELLKDSSILIFSDLCVIFNMNIDKVMLMQLMDVNDVGLYSVTITLVSTFYVVPLVIGSSITPKLTTLFESDYALYKRYVKKTYMYVGVSVILIGLLLSVFSKNIILLLYGKNYLDSAHLLTICAIALIFVSQVSLRGRMLIIEANTSQMLFFAVLSVITNVLMNIWLIPLYGAVGAAYAYIISWGFNANIFPLIFNKTRPHALMGLLDYVEKRP